MTTNTPFKTQLKHIKGVNKQERSKNTRRHAVYTLLNCAGECFQYLSVVIASAEAINLKLSNHTFHYNLQKYSFSLTE